MIKEKRAKGRFIQKDPEPVLQKEPDPLVSRFGLDDVSVTARFASVEEEETDFGSIASAEEEVWDDRSFTSVEGEESDDGSIEAIECNDDVLPFDIEGYLEELHELSGVGYSRSVVQDGSKAYYR